MSVPLEIFKELLPAFADADVPLEAEADADLEAPGASFFSAVLGFCCELLAEAVADALVWACTAAFGWLLGEFCAAAQKAKASVASARIP